MTELTLSPKLDLRHDKGDRDADNHATPRTLEQREIMRVRASLVAAIVITAAVLASTFVFGMRKKWRPVLTVVRRASRATKSIVLKTAGAPRRARVSGSTRRADDRARIRNAGRSCTARAKKPASTTCGTQAKRTGCHSLPPRSSSPSTRVTTSSSIVPASSSTRSTSCSDEPGVQ